MADNTKITVIIPTRDRSDVLRHSLLTALNQDYDNLNVVVCDNDSHDNTRDIVMSISNLDSRIKYVKTTKRLSMSRNWEFALSHVKDGWVTVLGDDDGLMPGAIENVADIIKHEKVSAVQSKTCSYIWPTDNMDYGRLSMELNEGGEVRDAGRWLDHVLHGKAHYLNLPTLYTGGFVDYDLVARAKKIGGDFYHSMTPDVFSSIALANFVSRYMYLRHSLAIGGASKHSTGSSSYATGSKEGMTAAKKFYSEGNIPFHEDLPLNPDGTVPRSTHLLVYEAWLQARKAGMIPDDRVTLDREEQLGIILASTKSKHREELSRWAISFSAMHDVRYEAAKNKALLLGGVHRISKEYRRISAILRTITIQGDSMLPMKNVFEASMVAATVRRVKGHISKGPQKNIT